MQNHEQIARLFEDVPAIPESTIQVKVEFNTDSELLSLLGKKYYQEMLRIGDGRVPGLDEITAELLTKYFKTLLYMRIAWVNSELGDAYRRVYNHLSIPVLMYHVLIPIGEARDKEFGIKFIPTITIDDSELLSVEELVLISDVMLRMENLGLAQEQGIPRDFEGELDYMAMVTVQNKILSYRQSHPVFAFLSSFVRKRRLDDRLGGVTRLFYGTEADFELQIQRVILACDGGLT